MIQTDGRNAEEIIELLLMKAKPKVRGDESGYISSLEYFFSCLLIKFMENAQLIDTNPATNPLLRYRTGTQLIHKIFGGKLNTPLLSMGRNNDGVFDGIIATFLSGCDDLTDKTNIDITEIGYLFEVFYNKDYNPTANTLRKTEGRKEHGMFFTKPETVRFIINAVTDGKTKAQLAASSFLDSSMGGGIFIFELLDFVNKKNIDINHFLANRVYGVDKNPLLVDIVRVSLWIKYHDVQLNIQKICDHLQAADSLTIFGDSADKKHTWHTLFPEVFENGGFDYIIGNPPWGKIKANMRDYSLLSNDFARHYNGVSLRNQMEQDASFEDWEEYKTRMSHYAEALKHNSGFQHQKYMIDEHATGGDFDLYKYFLELSFSILRNGGKLGYIIPASFYISEGTTGLRHLLLENGTIEYLINFINKKRIFPIHTSYKFVLLIYSKHANRKGTVRRAIFNLFEPEVLANFKVFKKNNFITYSIPYLEKCSTGYWAIPEFRNNYEKDLFLKFYARATEINNSNSLLHQVSYVRELDMTLDSSLFVQSSTTSDGELSEMIPVYEGRMVNQFDSAHKNYISGSGRTAVWKINCLNDRLPLRAQYYIRQEDIPNEQIDHYRACYCEITGQHNVRTILASLIPPNAICGNKVPTCKFEPDDRLSTHLYWIGVANSFLLDWVMRKKMTITINYFHWAQIPFPYANVNSSYFRDIVAFSAILLERINGFNISQFFDPHMDKDILKIYNECQNVSSGELRVMIDCIVSDMIGLTIDEMINVLYDFSSIDHGKDGIPGDLRYGTKSSTSYVTRDVLLYRYIKFKNEHVTPNIVELFAHAGLDISGSTGKIKDLSERINYYKDNHITPYPQLC